MNQKEIIFFHPHFSDGGVERTNIGLAKGCIKNGYKVVFLTTSFTNNFLEEIQALNIEFISLGDKKISMTLLDIVKYLNDKSKKSNMIYFVSCQYYVNIISMVASLFVKNRKNIRFINSERNHPNEFIVNGGLKNKFISIFIKFFYRYADLVIANSKETADDLSKLINRDVKYVYNPTINQRIDDLKDEFIIEEWYLNDERKCIIGIGRFSKQKDFETLIRAFHLFNSENQYKLVILGDGELRNDLEQLINFLNIHNDVYLPGFVSNPYKFLKQSSLFILSSRYEGLPNVLIEALYLEVLSISARCKSGPKEILKNNDLLVDVGDFEMMAKKIEYALNTREAFFKTDFDLSRFKYEYVINNFIKVME